MFDITTNYLFTHFHYSCSCLILEILKSKVYFYFYLAVEKKDIKQIIKMGNVRCGIKCIIKHNQNLQANINVGGERRDPHKRGSIEKPIERNTIFRTCCV